MKFIGLMNGWTVSPELWRALLWPPLRIRRMLVLTECDGELVFKETPAVYGIQILGMVLLVEINRGMLA